MRTLTISMLAMSLLTACGGGDSPAAEGEGESETEGEGEEGEAEGGREGEGEAEGEESESEAESECIREDCDDGDPCTTDRWDMERCECVHTSLREDCDDEVDCTDDSWNDGSCECEHQPLHARCFDPETRKGRICDAEDGCVAPPPCATEADCPESGTACLRRVCLTATATCDYPLLDSDEDDHSPQICAEFGGDDCDDSRSSTYPGAEEFCDGQDNDCNGEVDDLLQLGLPCDGWEDRDLCEEGVWECEGGESESEGEYELVCTDFTGNNDERCNGEDDDCDGEVDEDWWELGEPCDGTDGDFCEEGTFVCNAAGTDVTCTDTTDTTSEICNGLDDDCDGRADEDWPTLGRPCDGPDDDLCIEGTNICNAAGTDVTCTDTTDTTVEVCNGLDDDCDGRVDEDFGTLTCGIGACYRETPECLDGELQVCIPGTATEETCDGEDNDCDGLWDETGTFWLDGRVVEMGQPCDGLDDADLCEEGIWECRSIWRGGEDWDYWVECNDSTDTTTEICNDADDDCDGEVDEDWGELSEPCDGTDADFCADGIFVCDESGGDTRCTDDAASNVEVCNSLDDNCNGRVDEELATSCTLSILTACSAGTSIECACCDGIDNDGDGFPDRDDPDCDEDFWCATSTTNAPSARDSHTAIWTGSEMIVWGGWQLSTLYTGGRYDPATDTWTATSTPDAPSSRLDHTAIWTGSEMIVWGGNRGSSNRTNSGGRYDPATDTWSATSIVSPPSARDSHTAIWTGSEMIVWGGSNITWRFNTGGRYDPATDTWSATSIVSPPSAREEHTAVWTGSEMIVWGGWNGSERFNTGGRYDPESDTWTATSIVSPPSARDSHTAIWTGSEMIVWGGWGESFTLNTGGLYDPETNTWTATSTANAPSARNSHTAIWTGSEMIVWGGTLWFNTGGRYDPETDTWTATSIDSVPDSRSSHIAIWTGSEMVVWGGWDGLRRINTGGRYFPPQLAECGNGECEARETCASCEADCGVCPFCGDSTCDSDESCETCAEDCGVCPFCGDGTCNDDEDCASCEEDCGVCETTSCPGDSGDLSENPAAPCNDAEGADCCAPGDPCDWRSCNFVDPDCCLAGDPCGWGGDGYCDCNGDFSATWDIIDCSDCHCWP